MTESLDERRRKRHLGDVKALADEAARVGRDLRKAIMRAIDDGVSQGDIAKAVGVSRPRISQIVKEERRP